MAALTASCASNAGADLSPDQAFHGRKMSHRLCQVTDSTVRADLCGTVSDFFRGDVTDSHVADITSQSLFGLRRRRRLCSLVCSQGHTGFTWAWKSKGGKVIRRVDEWDGVHVAREWRHVECRAKVAGRRCDCSMAESCNDGRRIRGNWMVGHLSPQCRRTALDTCSLGRRRGTRVALSTDGPSGTAGQESTLKAHIGASVVGHAAAASSEAGSRSAEGRASATGSLGRSELRMPVDDSVNGDGDSGERGGGSGGGDLAAKGTAAVSADNTMGGKTRAQRQSAKWRERRKRNALPKPLRATCPVCYGCGAKLQTTNVDVPGYVDDAKYQLKKHHHQLGELMCSRCQGLSHGQMIAAVGGHGGYGNGKGFVLAEDLRRQLLGLQHQKVLVVKLVDIVDFNGSFLARVRDLIGANPIILVVTKVDLLPEGTDLSAVADWLLAATMRKKLNVMSIHMTSAKNGAGVSGVVANIMRERLGRDVYVLGAANVGKSAFISSLLDEMAERDIMAANARRYRPVQSAMPGTTLGPIRIKAFSTGGDLYDTPGVHLHHRMAAIADPDDLPLLAPRRRIRPYIVSSPLLRAEPPPDSNIATGLAEGVLLKRTASDDGGRESAQTNDMGGEFGETLGETPGEKRITKAAEESEQVAEETESVGLAGSTLFWGGLVRIDILRAPASVRFAFYGSTSVRVHIVPTSEADEFYERELGRTLSPPSSIERGKDWTGLHPTPLLEFAARVGIRPAGEVAVSGLGWFSISGIDDEKSTKDEDDDRDDEGGKEERRRRSEEEDVMMRRRDDGKSSGSRSVGSGSVSLAVHVPKGVEVFSRSPMPVGKLARDWYQWEDLSSFEENEERAKQLPAVYHTDAPQRSNARRGARAPQVSLNF